MKDDLVGATEVAIFSFCDCRRSYKNNQDSLWILSFFPFIICWTMRPHNNPSLMLTMPWYIAKKNNEIAL